MPSTAITRSLAASATPNALSHDAYAALYGTTYFLPTENEWYKAAFYSGSGSTYYQYATGSNSVPTAVYSGTVAGTAVFYGNGESPTAPAAVDEAGGLSPYGTMGHGRQRFAMERDGDWFVSWFAWRLFGTTTPTPSGLVLPLQLLSPTDFRAASTRVPRGK